MEFLLGKLNRAGLLVVCTVDNFVHKISRKSQTLMR